MIIAYINIQTLEYPLFLGTLRLQYPEMGEGDPNPALFAPVHAAQFPNINSQTQVVDELPPESVDGVWNQRLVVRDLTQQELDARAEEIRLAQELRAQEQQIQPVVDSTQEPQMSFSVTEL